MCLLRLSDAGVHQCPSVDAVCRREGVDLAAEGVDGVACTAATVRLARQYVLQFTDSSSALSTAACARAPGVAPSAWCANGAAEPEQVQGPRRERAGGGRPGLRRREGGHGAADAERRARGPHVESVSANAVFK